MKMRASILPEAHWLEYTWAFSTFLPRCPSFLVPLFQHLFSTSLSLEGIKTLAIDLKPPTMTKEHSLPIQNRVQTQLVYVYSLEVLRRLLQPLRRTDSGEFLRTDRREPSRNHNADQKESDTKI